MPALHLPAGKGLVLLFRAELVARRVAGAAVAEAFDEIRAAVPLRALRRIRLVGATLQVARFPETDARPRQRHRIAEVLLVHRLARHHEGIERGDVLVAELGEMIVRECGKEVAPAAI